MAERADARTWTHRCIFMGLAFVIVVAQLVPLDMRPINWAPPDLLLVITLGTITIGIMAITVLNRLILAITMVPQAPLGMTLIEMIATILVYPLVVLVAHFIFGVRRSAPGEIGSRGQKI